MFWYNKRYTTRLNESEIHGIIAKIIDIEEESTFENHWASDRIGGDNLVKGTKEGDQAVLWRTNTTWNGIFYPIFSIIMSDNTILIKVRFNKAAEVIVLIIGILLILGLFWFIIGIGFEFPQVLNRFLAGIVIFFIFMSVPLISFHSLKSQTLSELVKILELSAV